MWNWLDKFIADEDDMQIKDVAPWNQYQNPQVKPEETDSEIKIKRLEARIEQLEEALRGESRASQIVVDFEILSVVSIERFQTDVKNDGIPYTIVSYLDGTMNVTESYIYCNQAGHEQLVNEFKEVLKRRYPC